MTWLREHTQRPPVCPYGEPCRTSEGGIPLDSHLLFADYVWPPCSNQVPENTRIGQRDEGARPAHLSDIDCDPSVVPIAGFFKPSTDPRSATEFARDNWSFCQKEYVQDGIRTAMAVPKELAEAQAAVVGSMSDIFWLLESSS